MPAPDPFDLLAPADALAAMLRGETSDNVNAKRAAAVAKLAGVPVIVRRQGDIDSLIEKKVAKAKGAAILIGLDGWDEGPQESGAAQLALRHSISLWTVPIMRAGDVPEMIVLGALVRAVHAWTPDASQHRKGYRWRVGQGDTGEALTKGKQTLNVAEFPAIFEMTLES